MSLTSSSVKLKLIGSDKQRAFIKKLVTECVCKVKEEYDDLTGEKNSSHLIQSIMSFIETKIVYSKFKDDKFDKKKILYLILNTLFPDEYQDENELIESIVRHICDNKLIKVTKSNVFLKGFSLVYRLAREFLK